MKRKRTLSNDFEQNVETLSKELRVDKTSTSFNTTFKLATSNSVCFSLTASETI